MNYRSLDKTQVQFGVFCGKTFSWILNNALGYAGYIVDKVVNVDKEREVLIVCQKVIVATNADVKYYISYQTDAIFLI